MKKILMCVCMLIIMIAMAGCGNANQGTFENLQVRADKATAEQIGKSVVIWNVEYNTDIAFKIEAENSGKTLSTDWVKVSELGKIEEFIDVDNTSIALENADYYAAQASERPYKIMIGISNNDGTDLSHPKDVAGVDEYTGENSAIVWIEPDYE